MLNQTLPRLDRRHEQVVHVVRLFAVLGNGRSPDASLFRPAGKMLVVEVPNRGAALEYLIGLFKLCQQKGGQNIRRRVAGPYLDPGVLVHFPAKELLAVGPLVPQYFGTRDVVGVVDQKGAAFAAGNVLGFMKALRCERAECPQMPSLVPR